MIFLCFRWNYDHAQTYDKAHMTPEHAAYRQHRGPFKSTSSLAPGVPNIAPTPSTLVLFHFHTTQHMLEPSPLVLVAVTVVVTIFYTNRRRTWLNRLRGCRLPPGPRGWLIVGSLFDMPSGERPWTVYREWAQKYGKIPYNMMTRLCCLLIGVC